MNYFLLQDLTEAEVDAIIITTASKEDIENAIITAKETEGYTWETLLECMPKETTVIDCFNNKNRVYYQEIVRQ